MAMAKSKLGIANMMSNDAHLIAVVDHALKYQPQDQVKSLYQRPGFNGHDGTAMRKDENH